MGSKINSENTLKKYKKLLWQNKIGMWEWDLKKNIIFFDDGIRILYELEMIENYADPEVWYEYIHPDDHGEVMASIMDLIHADNDLNSIFRIKTPKGTPKYIQTYAYGEKNNDGKVIRLIGMNLDVSETQNIQNILIEQSKLAHLGQITSELAHEVNNPLSIIVGKANLLKARLVKEPLDHGKLLSDIESIEKNSDRIRKIIGSLNTFSRNSIHDPFEIISILKIFDAVFEMIKEKLKKNMIDFIIIIDEKITYSSLIEARESEILQVLINLLNNSYDAVKNRDTKWIKINIFESANQYEISVMDSGPQIQPEIANNMMRPFYTTKPTGQGTGLGLSLALQIVTSHNGSLVYNTKSVNTEFIFKINKKIK
jgi:signal transduction histidine kinase